MTDDLKFEMELKDLNLSLYQFNKRREELFKEALDDLKFQPQKNNVIDRKISMILKIKKIKDIPVIHLKDDLYFVGLYKVYLTIVGDYLYLKIS